MMSFFIMALVLPGSIITAGLVTDHWANQSIPILSTAQHRLMLDLFSNRQYDVRAGPTPPVHVIVRFNLYQLVEVDERSQHVLLYAWITQMWNDTVLIWDPEDYDGVRSIVVPYQNMWLPDTYLYNSLKMNRHDSEHWINVILKSETPTNPNLNYTSVIFRYPALYKFTCSMDVTYFPFDIQHCRMVFGSWTLDSSKLIFLPEKKKVNQEDYQENEEWTVVKLEAGQYSVSYTCCPYPFSFVNVDIVLKRRPLHYLINLFVPILIVSTVANFGFFSPSSANGERKQKVGLGMSTLLALSIILVMLADKMPITSSSVPLVGRFFIGMMVQTAVALLATTVVMYIERRVDYIHPVPFWIRRIMFGCVARLLGIERRKSHKYHRMVSSNSIPSDTSVIVDSTDPEATVLMENPSVSRLSIQISELRSILARKYKNMEIDDRNMLDWEWLACILDRIFLILSLFSICILCGLILILGFMQHFWIT